LHIEDAAPRTGRHSGHLDPAFCSGAGFDGFAVEGAGLLPGFAGLGFDFGSIINASISDRVFTRDQETMKPKWHH